MFDVQTIIILKKIEFKQKFALFGMNICTYSILCVFYMLPRDFEFPFALCRLQRL